MPEARKTLVGVHLTPDEAKAVTDAASAERRSKSSWCRNAILDALTRSAGPGREPPAPAISHTGGQGRRQGEAGPSGPAEIAASLPSRAAERGLGLPDGG